MLYQAISTARAAVFRPARTLLPVATALCVRTISAPAFAQRTTATVCGNATLDGVQAMAGATVTVTNTFASGRRTATTTSTGKEPVSGLRKAQTKLYENQPSGIPTRGDYDLYIF